MKTRSLEVPALAALPTTFPAASQRSSVGTAQTTWADRDSGTLVAPVAYSLPFQPVLVCSSDTVPWFGSAAPAVIATTPPAAITTASRTARPGTDWRRLFMTPPADYSFGG